MNGPFYSMRVSFSQTQSLCSLNLCKKESKRKLSPGMDWVPSSCTANSQAERHIHTHTTHRKISKNGPVVPGISYDLYRLHSGNNQIAWRPLRTTKITARNRRAGRRDQRTGLQHQKMPLNPMFRQLYVFLYCVYVQWEAAGSEIQSGEKHVFDDVSLGKESSSRSREEQKIFQNRHLHVQYSGGGQ